MLSQKKAYKTLADGRQVDKYIIKNKNNMQIEILTLGATVEKLFVNDKYGNKRDITLGFDDIDSYLSSDYQGAAVGPYANRIAGGAFSVGENIYTLERNDNGKNSLHSNRLFTNAIWEAETIENDSVKLTLFTPDGSEGFPGDISAEVIYSLSDDDSLKIEYRAKTTKPTFYNPTNHMYFNLSGYDSTSILDTVLQINAEFFTPVDENLIPTGEIRSVKDTPFTFLTPIPIGERIDFDDEQLLLANGYDHNYCFMNTASGSPGSANAYDKKSGIFMTVETDMPGIQLYTGNFLKGDIGKNGKAMPFRSAFCLETQFYPDTPNQKDFPSCLLEVGEEFYSRTTYSFSTR